VQHRKRGAQAFEKTHERITLWIDKGLKHRFEELVEEEGAAKTTLLNEAIADLLEKYQWYFARIFERN
jgi:predicted transcriptional regulator